MLLLTRLKHIHWQSRHSLLLFIFVLLISAVFRFKPVVEGTFPFLYDHGRDMLDVREIVEHHNFTFIGPTTGLKGLYHGPIHYYLLSIGYILSSGNPSSGVIMVIIFQLSAGIACYFLGSHFINSRFGVFLSVIYLLALSSINTSSMFWNPYWIPFFMVIFYFSLLQTFRSHPVWWLAVGLLGGLIAQFEIAFGIFLIPFILITGILFQKEFYKNKFFWLSFVLFIMPFSPLILFDIKHEFQMLHAIQSVFNGTYTALGESVPFPLRFDYRLTELLRITVKSLSFTTALNYLLFVLALISLVVSISRKQIEQVRYFVLFLLLPAIVFCGFLLYSKQAWSYYWVGLQVSYYFFVAYGLYLLDEQQRVGKFIARGSIAVFILLSFQVILQDTSFLEKEPGIFRNQMQVINTVYASTSKMDFGAYVYTPPIYDYTYQYLFYWRAKQLRRLPPTHSTKREYFLIMEENKDRPWEITGWKSGLVPRENPLWKRVFPGRITVEKYEHIQD